jgi:metal-dependent amidase/aminoacylase/carboxypeptidase family protein
VKRLILGALAISFVTNQMLERLNNQINQIYDFLERKITDWRRDFNENPELSNQEFCRRGKVAIHLRSFEVEVQIGVTLRADIDGLIPFESMEACKR